LFGSHDRREFHYCDLNKRIDFSLLLKFKLIGAN